MCYLQWDCCHCISGSIFEVDQRVLSRSISGESAYLLSKILSLHHGYLTLVMKVPDTMSDSILKWLTGFEAALRLTITEEKWTDDCRYKEDMQIIHLSAFSPFNRTRCVPSVAVWSLR